MFHNVNFLIETQIRPTIIVYVFALLKNIYSNEFLWTIAGKAKQGTGNSDCLCGGE